MGCFGKEKRKRKLLNRTIDSAKVVILGDSGVGKSSLTLRFVKKEFREDTNVNIGAEVSEAKILLDSGDSVSLYVWDTAGQERFRSITQVYYKASKAAAIVYDITRQKSFENCEYWVKELKNNEPNCSLILVGNKIDVNPRQVNEDKAREYAEANGMDFIETSAKSDLNVEILFKKIGQNIINSHK